MSLLLVSERRSAAGGHLGKREERRGPIGLIGGIDRGNEGRSWGLMDGLDSTHPSDHSDVSLESGWLDRQDGPGHPIDC